MNVEELEMRIVDLEAEVASLRNIAQRADFLLAAMLGKIARQAGASIDVGLPDEMPESDADKWAMSIILEYDKTAL